MLFLEQDSPYPRKNKLTHRSAPSGSLFFQLAIKRRRNVYSRANRFFFHDFDYLIYAINMEYANTSQKPTPALDRGCEKK